MSEDPIRLAGGDVNFYSRVRNNPGNWIDPMGLWIPQAIGATINLGFEGYAQYQSGDLDIGRLVVAAGTGALSGFGSTLGRAMFFGASANILNTAYKQSSDPCQSLDLWQLARSGAYGGGGGVFGYAGGAIGNSILRTTKVIGATLGQWPASHYGASGAAIGATLGGYFANQ